MKLRYASILALSAAVSAQADTYRVELNAGFGQGDAEVDSVFDLPELDYEGYVVAGTAYFSDINTGTGPLREAAFLNKASGIGVTRTDFSIEDSIDVVNTTVSGRFGFANDFIFEASAHRLEIEDFEADTFSVGLGTYLNDNSDIVATFSSSNDTDTDTLGVDYHSVIQNNDSAWAIDLGANYIDSPGDSGHGLTAGATYYPTPALGIGAVLVKTSIGDLDTDSVTAMVEYFFNTNFASSINYTTSDDDTLGLEVGLWSVDVTARF